MLLCQVVVQPERNTLQQLQAPSMFSSVCSPYIPGPFNKPTNVFFGIPHMYALQPGCLEEFVSFKTRALHALGVSCTNGKQPMYSSNPQCVPAFALADVPYDLSPEFVEELFTKHKIDYIIHGDDPCLLPDGTDAYAHAKKLGRFKMVS
jgi:hypothetical protein